MRSQTRLVYDITKYMHYFTYFLEVLNFVVVVLRHKSEIFNLKMAHSFMISYGDTVYVNFIRNTVEPDLERHFFAVLQRLGVDVTVESNQNGR